MAPDDFISSRHSAVDLCDGRLLVLDRDSHDSLVAVIDPDRRELIGRVIRWGQGPDEIQIPGAMFVTSAGKVGIFDHGQRNITMIDLDSALTHDRYHPQKNVKLDESTFPSEFVYLNDSVGYARQITFGGRTRSFTQDVCKFNPSTGALSQFGNFNHLDDDISDICPSDEGDAIMESLTHRDLTIIYDRKGNVVKMIKGPDFSEENDANRNWCHSIAFADGHFLISNSHGQEREPQYFGQWIDLFHPDGEYVETLDLGIGIVDMAFDSASGYLYVVTDDEPQFGRIDLRRALKGEELNEVALPRSEALQSPASSSTTTSSIPPIKFVEPQGSYDALDFKQFDPSVDNTKCIGLLNTGSDTLYIDRLVPSNPKMEVDTSWDRLWPSMTISFQATFPAGTLPAGKVNEYVDIYFTAYPSPKRLPIIGTAK